ncbi:MAG: AAA family ATPase [Candidatus Omnitrophota bacterium]
MSYKIAIAGKGGTGKTTLAALIIRELLARNKTPILAVDADPNSNLNEALGVEYDSMIADIREEIPQKQLPVNVTKSDYINKRLQEAIAEFKGFDLLVMGRPEGPGCYCYVNELLRQHLSKLGNQYKFVVMDNEAGMEHLSRRTTDDIDLLIVTSDQTLVGIRSAGRVVQVLKSLKLKIKKKFLVINRAKPALTAAQNTALEETGLELLGVIPEDETINSYREQGRNLLDSSASSKAVSALSDLIQKAGV